MLTFPLRIIPIICGARNPIIFATELVKPINVPEKLGAISMWLQVTELKLNPFSPTVTHSKATTICLLHLAKYINTKQIPGGTKARNKFE